MLLRIVRTTQSTGQPPRSFAPRSLVHVPGTTRQPPSYCRGSVCGGVCADRRRRVRDRLEQFTLACTRRPACGFAMLRRPASPMQRHRLLRPPCLARPRRRPARTHSRENCSGWRYAEALGPGLCAQAEAGAAVKTSAETAIGMQAWQIRLVGSMATEFVTIRKVICYGFGHDRCLSFIRRFSAPFGSRSRERARGLAASSR